MLYLDIFLFCKKLCIFNRKKKSCILNTDFISISRIFSKISYDLKTKLLDRNIVNKLIIQKNSLILPTTACMYEVFIYSSFLQP